MNNEKLTDQEIDERNMDSIDAYIAAKKEYDEKGYWTGFMGIQCPEEPQEPRLLTYSWEYGPHY